MSWKAGDLFKQGQPRNDFDVQLTDEHWCAEWQDLFAAQVVRLEMNLVECEVTVFVRQLRAGVIQDIIFNMLTRDEPLGVLHLKPVSSKKKGAEYSFVNGILVEHKAVFDYLSKDVIVHKLVLRFGHVNLKSPTGEMNLTHYADVVVDTDFDPTIPEDD